MTVKAEYHCYWMLTITHALNTKVVGVSFQYLYHTCPYGYMDVYLFQFQNSMKFSQRYLGALVIMLFFIHDLLIRSRIIGLSCSFDCQQNSPSSLVSHANWPHQVLSFIFLKPQYFVPGDVHLWHLLLLPHWPLPDSLGSTFSPLPLCLPPPPLCRSLE
jgi:hypothetical protein